MAMGLVRTRALCAVVLTAGLIFAMPVAASADDPDEPGKSAVVAVCKKGAWMALAPQDDAAVPFRNQGACVRYLAQGGAVVDTTGVPVLPGQRRGCQASKQKTTDAPEQSQTKPCALGKDKGESQGKDKGKSEGKAD